MTVVVDEPSIVAKDIQSGKIVAIGKKAQQMYEDTPIDRNREASTMV